MTSIVSKTLHFDSINSNYTTASAFDTTYVLTTPLQNVVKIHLESLEMPINFTTVRDSTGSLNTISFIINSTTYTYTLPNKNYSVITDLLTDLNTLLYAVGVYRLVFTTTSLSTPLNLTSSNNGTTTTLTDKRIKITISSTDSTIFTYKLVDTQLLNYVLGIKSKPTSLGVLGDSIYGLSDYNLNIDN